MHEVIYGSEVSCDHGAFFCQLWHMSDTEGLEAGLASLRMDTNADGGIVTEIKSRHGHSAQPESQQVLAVLQAVLEVIGAEGMAATPTTIFAALMSALDRQDAQSSPVVRVQLRPVQLHRCGTACACAQPQFLATNIVDWLQTTLAMCTVLGVTLTRVPNSVLRSKFVSSVQLLGKLVEQHRQQVGLTAVAQEVGSASMMYLYCQQAPHVLMCCL